MEETALVLMLSNDNSDQLAIRRLKEVSINAAGSPHTKLSRDTSIEEFITWSLQEGSIKVSAEGLLAYQAHLVARQTRKGEPLAPSTVNVKMAAVRSLVRSAATIGWISEETEEKILERVQFRPVKGRRQGQRMSIEAVRACLLLPDRSTLRGKRDYAILGLLFSCGLRRAELCSLRPSIMKQIDNGWALVDLVGKRQKVRSVPVGEPIKNAVDDWLAAANITEGRIFREIHRGGKVMGTGLSEMTIWNIIRHYAAQVGYKDFAPHDARRSCARIYYDANGKLPQIQYLLGHEKLDTTAKYVNDEQKFGQGAISNAIDIS